MTNGKWTCSTNEEHWNCTEEFDTRDEALAYAMSEFAPEHGIEDGQSVWVGQIADVDLDRLAGSACDAWSAVDQMTQWLYDNVGEFASDDLDVSKEVESDLDERLAKCVLEWMAAHSIKPSCFTIDPVERHVWERCKEGRAVPHAAHPDMDDVVERCVLPIEHDGVCEWL